MTVSVGRYAINDKSYLRKENSPIKRSASNVPVFMGHIKLIIARLVPPHEETISLSAHVSLVATQFRGTSHTL